MRRASQHLRRLGYAAGIASLLAGCGNDKVASTVAGPVSFGSIDLTANGTGTCKGTKSAQLWTLTNAHGLVAKLMDYGATLVEMHVPDKNGTMADVVQGFDSVAGYANSQFAGATVGRVGNRIANGTFTVDGMTYTVTGAGPADANPPNHSLHGGPCGWDKNIWTGTVKDTADGPQITFTLTSADGDMNFPGQVMATSTYTLTNNNELKIVMTATPSKPTPINMLHHSYWNLAGVGTGVSVYTQELTIFADQYTPPAANGVPDGTMTNVAGTAYDFTSAHAMGLNATMPGVQSEPGILGYDHNWVVRGTSNELRDVARYKDPVSGRVMTVRADQPGVQFYTTNYRPDPASATYMPTIGKGGKEYKIHEALALETQKHPNAINFPATVTPGAADEIVRPPAMYSHTMIHTFTAE